MFKPSKSSLTHSLLATLFTVLPVQNAFSAPGTLPTAPLFLSTLVEPNVFLTLDDSGSMDWGPLVSEGDAGFTTSSGLPILNGKQRAYYTPTFTRLYTDRYVIPPSDGNSAVWDTGWALRNYRVNRNYYNPNVKYGPWAGTEADGTPMYGDADPTSAWKDPNKTSATDEKIDLTQVHSYNGTTATSKTMWIPTYYIWNDTDNDGVVEQTDGRTEVKIAVGTPGMQNFANWFVYYRSRINATKAIIGRTINNTDASRMGMSLFNAGHQNDVDTMSNIASKRTLLKSLYGIVIPQKGTPARTALEKVGIYFKSTAANAPILDFANGGECQQNFNILMSDGFWNGANPSVNNADGDKNTLFDGDDGRSGVASFKSNDGGNYADTFSNSLADVSMHLYETDLRSDLGNKVPTQTGVDEAEHQHLVTYSIAFGLNGQLDPTTDDPLAASFAWPEPVANSLTTVDDMWHAAYNSRGKYLSAQNPEQLQTSLDAAITNISERTGTAAAVAINSAQLSTESVVYLAQFNSNRWQGNVLAFPIINTDTGELAAAPKWDAASKLTSRVTPRTIITYSDAASDGVAFQWADISANMQNDLNTNAAGATDTLGEKRLDYLRGDRSNEGSGAFFRNRISMLGDIVNSGPVFVGAPSLNWPDSAPFPENADAYSEFKNSSAATRKKMVYVGANDGMLHAFDDDTGDEVFAYIPGMVSSSNTAEGLHYLTDPNYLHRFYVDQTPALSDVYISSDLARWHTVLVGGMRSGGRGIFALDVTNPAQFTEANASQTVLWEFTSEDDADVGYTFSRPFIAYTNNNTWVAIFGNGYNPVATNGSGQSSTGEASLFIVDIERGIDGSWATAGDYKKISTGAGTIADPNSLTTPALADVDGNGTVDRVYAGDLKGNMWAFDLSAVNPASWGSAYKSGASPIPLFTTPAGQPITAKPVLAKHPTQPDSGSPSNAPNIMVYFGTGQYLVDADKTSPGVQSFYGVWDKGDSGLDNTTLIEQTFDGSFSVRVLSRNPVDYAIHDGWYFNLPETGERSVTSPIARADTVFFNSFVPVDDPCSIGGFGFKFAVDMTTGGSPLEPTFDADGNGVIDENDMVSNGISDSTLVAVKQEGYLPEPVFIEDLAFTAEVATKIKALQDIPVGRFSWQELLQ